MATRSARTKTATAPAPEVVEDEFEEFEDDDETPAEADIEESDEDDDLEELEEVEEEETTETPTKTKATKAKAEKAAKAPTIEFGSPWLATHVSQVTGEKYDARAVRMLLRKMAADGKLARKVGEDRNRYSFTGPEDTTVKAVITMIKSGEAKALKQAGLEKVKADAEKKRAAAKAAKAAEESEEMDEMEEVEEAPAKKTTTRRATTTKTATAAPAKAAPSTRRKAPAKA